MTDDSAALTSPAPAPDGPVLSYSREAEFPRGALTCLMVFVLVAALVQTVPVAASWISVARHPRILIDHLARSGPVQVAWFCLEGIVLPTAGLLTVIAAGLVLRRVRAGAGLLAISAPVLLGCIAANRVLLNIVNWRSWSPSSREVVAHYIGEGYQVVLAALPLGVALIIARRLRQAHRVPGAGLWRWTAACCAATSAAFIAVAVLMAWTRIARSGGPSIPAALFEDVGLPLTIVAGVAAILLLAATTIALLGVRGYRRGLLAGAALFGIAATAAAFPEAWSLIHAVSREGPLVLAAGILMLAQPLLFAATAVWVLLLPEACERLDRRPGVAPYGSAGVGRPD
jgi:hypothetical protein